MNALLAFAATLVSVRLTAELVRRSRLEPERPELLLWTASLVAYSIAAIALAWGAAAGWDDVSFRVYYLAGGLLTAPLLGLGSLRLAGFRFATPLAFAYSGLATGIMLAESLTQPVTGVAIPDAQEHLDFVPARLLAIAGNSLGTLAVVVIALLSFRRRPLQNSLLLLGVAIAAAGSAVSGLGVSATAAFVAVAAAVLYAGFVAPRSVRDLLPGQPRESSHSPPAV